MELPDQESAHFDEVVEAGPDAFDDAACQDVVNAEYTEETLETMT